MESVLLDIAGHRRPPATMLGYRRGRPPRNKGERYPADPSQIALMACAYRSSNVLSTWDVVVAGVTSADRPRWLR